MRAFLDHFRAIQPAFIESLRGAPEVDVEKLEDLAQVKLPDDYREFLLTMGATVPETRFIDGRLVLCRNGRRWIDFALETVIECTPRRRKKKNGRFKTKRPYLFIGEEEGCTGYDAYIDLREPSYGRVVLSEDLKRGVVPWFDSFREMLFAVGFYDLQVKSGHVQASNGKRSTERTKKERELSPSGPWVVGMPGKEWEKTAVAKVAAEFNMERSPHIGQGSVAYSSSGAAILFSNLFETPIGTPLMRAYVSTTNKPEGHVIYKRLAEELDL